MLLSMGQPFVSHLGPNGRPAPGNTKGPGSACLPGPDVSPASGTTRSGRSVSVRRFVRSEMGPGRAGTTTRANGGAGHVSFLNDPPGAMSSGVDFRPPYSGRGGGRSDTDSSAETMLTTSAPKKAAQNPLT